MLAAKNDNVYITKKSLEALRTLVLNGQRKWKCKALSNFLVVDHLGRIAGCHSREPLSSIFDLPRIWNSKRFEELRKEYQNCTNCAYLCYIFYSMYTGISGSLGILREQWRNARNLMKNNAK